MAPIPMGRLCLTRPETSAVKRSAARTKDGVVYELVFSAGKYKEKVLWSFTGTGGANPGAAGWYGLTPDGAGNFYSATAVGGTDNWGLVFELTP